jgi:hypothetical protein
MVVCSFQVRSSKGRQYHNPSQRILATKPSELYNVQLNRGGDVGQRDARRRARLRVRAEKLEASLLCLRSARWHPL